MSSWYVSYASVRVNDMVEQNDIVKSLRARERERKKTTTHFHIGTARFNGMMHCYCKHYIFSMLQASEMNIMLWRGKKKGHTSSHKRLCMDAWFICVFCFSHQGFVSHTVNKCIKFMPFFSLHYVLCTKKARWFIARYLRACASNLRVFLT